jgi:hypothetical protein
VTDAGFLAYVSSLMADFLHICGQEPRQRRRAFQGTMKIACTLLLCAITAVVLTLLPHRHAAAASAPHRTSAALAETMSSHGIEVAAADHDAAPAPPRPAAADTPH